MLTMQGPLDGVWSACCQYAQLQGCQIHQEIYGTWRLERDGGYSGCGDPRSRAVSSCFCADAEAGRCGWRVPGESCLFLNIPGTCQTVGLAGGYIQGGGHGPLSGIYGMGADNVLSLDAITAEGEYVTANAEENPDLYWALKGGGPGTFAVVTPVLSRPSQRCPPPALPSTSTARTPTTRRSSTAASTSFTGRQTTSAGPDEASYVNEVSYGCVELGNWWLISVGRPV